MANEKSSRGTAAKRTTTARAPKANNPVSAPVPTTEEPVSTAQATVATSRNAVIEGNATIDLDSVRRRAYELYEERGRLDGYHEQDWYSAEQELSGRKQSRSQNGSGTERKDSQRSA
ncbi:MAG TPA: DUF2934 domain-containing protein [Terriglobales bacterium]|nr:DUF2934 domain-containing protein [Terriglobales bacterium]